MASLFTSQVPASPDVDNGNSISLGTYFVPAVDGFVTAIRWYFPASAQPGGAAVKGALFRTSDSAKIGADVSFASPGTPGAWNEVALASPVAVTQGVQYCASVRSPARYVATTGGASPWPLANGDLSAPSGAGRFEDDDGDGSVQFPTDSFNNGCYFVDLVFTTGDEPAEGAAALGLGLAVAATGGADAEGSAALGLGYAVAASGARGSQGVAALGLNLAVAATGGRDADGSADTGLNLAVSAAGSRAAAGAAALGLGLAVAATGQALDPAEGTAALGLRYAVAAHGSNGSTGRPVTAWPYGLTSPSSYPWTPRAVRPFSEVEAP